MRGGRQRRSASYPAHWRWQAEFSAPF